jgi:monoamine oxidase
VPEVIDADVCVVGAGYAGLTAAWRLHQAGRSVVVLEARDRVGGRIWTERADDGTALDRGGAWLAPYHEAALRLAGELGVGTYKTYVDGAHLLVDGDRLRRYTGLIPKISPAAVASIALTQARLDRLAKTVPLLAPWDAPRAAEWDARSVRWWVDHARIASPTGRNLFETAVRGLFATDLTNVSFLDLLFLAHSHTGINALFSIEKGAQENLVEGGAGAMAHRLAERLGDAVRLGAAVTRLAPTATDVTVETATLGVRARHAIVATPPALTLEMAFDPALPPDRAALYRAAVAGHETKTLVIYDEPFWRAAGFSGQSADPGSPAEVTIDASPSSGAPGVLACFTFGPVAEYYDAMDPTARRDALLAVLQRRFGARAAHPAAVVETPWWHEPWTRGCSMAHFPIGVLTRYGHLLREPMGTVHWAGTETAAISHGAIDGAIRSGERAAAEVLDRL